MIKNKIIFLTVFIVIAVFLVLPNRVYALTCAAYKVSVVKSDGTATDLSCYLTYNEAKNAMLSHNSDINNVAVVYNASKIVVNAKYAVVKFKSGIVSAMYPTASSTARYTSTHTSYGLDAAFLDYDATTNKVKIRISGYSGWVAYSDVEKIIPVSTLSASQIQIKITSLNVRATASTTAAALGSLSKGAVTQYFQKVSAGGRYWYRILYNGQTGWVADDATTPGTNMSEFTGIGLKTYYIKSSGVLSHFYAYQGSSGVAQTSVTIDNAPTYLTDAQIYYSFDGNYFYDSITKMLGDYRGGVSTNAVNVSNPYFAYFMYLPTRSKTGYRATNLNSVISGKGYTRNKVAGVTYVNNYSPYDWTAASRSGMSVMYNTGQDFIDMANTYGVNALMMFGTALNESASGTSKIAFLKNNLFGLGAADSNPVVLAYSYANPRASVEGFATFTGSSNSNYTNPVNGSYYYGSHYGNKGSGMNVYYATDPYWGEKQAKNSYNNDKSYGGLDHKANTIGITKGLDVKVYKDANTSGTVLYTIKNNKNNKSVYNVPVVVFDKVTVSGANWYKVYTDLALDSNRNISAGNYNFNYSYAYIREADLFVVNNQPTITVQNQEMVEASAYNLFTGITASDNEDGNITSSVKISGNYNINVPGTYPITYTATDSEGLSVSKNAILTVTNSLYARIIATDKEVSRYTVFNPLTAVSATDYRDGNVTGDIIVTNNTVDTDTEGAYTVTYEVTNSLSNVTVKTITVTVVPNEAPVINAVSKSISVGDAFNPVTNVTVTDKEQGNITSDIQVTANTVDVNTPGTYTVTYLAEDAAGNTVNKTIDVTVYLKPSVASGLRLTSTTYNSVTIAWNASLNATNYDVYYAISLNGVYKKLVSTNKTTYTHTGLATGRYYYYKIQAFRINPTLVNYANSSTGLVTRVIPNPPKVTAKKLSSTSLRVYASGVAGASGY